MLRQTQPSLHRQYSPGTTHSQAFGRCFGRPSTCVRQQRPGPSSSVYSPAAVRGNTIGASHLHSSSGLRQRQDATTSLAAQARSGNSADAPSGADSIHLSGFVLDSDAVDAAFPGLLTGAADAELVVNTLGQSSAAGKGVPLVPHACAVTNTSPELRRPSIAICAPSSLGEALALQPGNILDLQLSGGEVVAEVVGNLRAPPPPANTVTLARVVVLGDLYVSPDVNMTTSHFKWTTPIRIRQTIMGQLLGKQVLSNTVPGSSYDVRSAVPPGQSQAAAAAAGAGLVVAKLDFHLNESAGTSYWRLLGGIHGWAARLGGVGGDALRLALAVGGISEVPADGEGTRVKTCITARLVKRTTAGGVVAAAAADTAPPQAAVAPPPPPTVAAGVVPAPSSTPAAVAPGSIARPRRASQRGKGKAKPAQQVAAAAATASDLQQLNRTAELILAAVERIEVLLREQQQQQQRAE